MPPKAPSSLPWFVRLGDRLVDRHEHWATDMRSSAEFYEKLLLWATTRDANARSWLAEALARYDYAGASRVWMWYLLIVCAAGFFVAFSSLTGCGVVLLLLLAVPLLVRFDRWNRRRIAWNRLAEGEPQIYEKVEVKAPPEGSRIFQSYWRLGDRGPVELDHPMELWDAVEQANEWWQYLMPMPHDGSNSGVTWLTVHQDVGLVHRDARGKRRLLAAGVVYFPYDPWADRIETDGYA